MQLVRENIDFNTPESLSYALELMNIFLDERIKPRIFPLFDDLNTDERVKKLATHYAPELFRNYTDVLTQIVNRDYNRMGAWAKALATYRLASVEDAKVSMDLVANMHNPNPVLLQSTAFVLLEKDKHAYRRVTMGLGLSLIHI